MSHVESQKLWNDAMQIKFVQEIEDSKVRQLPAQVGPECSVVPKELHACLLIGFHTAPLGPASQSTFS